MLLDYTHPRNLLVQTLQRLYDAGMTTTSGGNISIKDEDGNIWITPGGVDKGTLTPADIVKVTPAGEVIGRHNPSCELPFHSDVYKFRPDVKCVLHAHSPALVAFSLVGKIPNPNIIPNVAKLCGKVAFAKYELPGSLKLGAIISAEFEKGADSVIMENHGAVMCGTTITEAFARFEALDYVARIQINATSFGKEDKFNYEQNSEELADFKPNSISTKECEIRDEIVRFRARCYQHQLLFSSSSFLSSRISHDDFIVTPDNFEPMYLDAFGMVRICEGKKECGKTPVSLTPLIREIYKKCEWINSIIMTKPPHIMAFAVTKTAIDSRTIPESYIMMRDVPVLSANDFVNNLSKVIEKLTPATPVILVENYGVLTTGKSLLEAFDRLEVSEFTAKCLIMAQKLGRVKPINQAQVDEIIIDFNLPKA